MGRREPDGGGGDSIKCCSMLDANVNVNFVS